MNSQQFSIAFKDISKKDVAIAGGKGASLGELMRSGLPVPDGYIILSKSFEFFLQNSKLKDRIDMILSQIDGTKPDSIDKASTEITRLVLAAHIPNALEDDIKKSFYRLNARFVAVRSSATSEDGSSSAWAGQLDTYLNTTEGQLLQNIKRCWASLFTSRAIFYRLQKGFIASEISVAVVIQKMVQSDSAGIAFSVHPVTEDRNVIIIEACFGLGEAVVSGTITPDNYAVTKKPMKIIDKQYSLQERAMIRSKSGGNRWINLKNTHSEHKLSDDEILALSKLVIRIEKHYGFPCDIEWAKEAGKFYVIQSRPITTLSQKRIKNPKKTKSEFVKVWSEEDHNYFDLEPSLLNYGVRCENLFDYGIKEGMMFGKGFHASFYLSKNELNRSRENGYSFLTNPRKFKFLLSEIKKSEEDIRERIRSLISSDLEGLSNKELFDLYGFYGHALGNIFVCYSMTQPSRISKLEGQLITLIKESGVKDVYGTVSILASPKVKFVFTKNGNDLFKSFSETVKLETNKIDMSIADKSLYDEVKIDDGPREKLVSKLKLGKESIHISDVLSQLAQERLEMRFCWMSALYLNDLFFIEFKRRFKIRKSDLRMYDANELDGLLLKNIRLSKVKLSVRKKGFLKILNDKKITTFEGNEAQEYVNLVDMSSSINASNKITGMPASKGKAVGKVIIFSYKKAKNHSERTRKITSGNILVTEMTRPNIIQACQKAAAIVTDEGGITSHAAIVAREFGKPCIVGTGNATSFLKDGDLVVVDADNGIVKLLKRAKSR